MPPALIAIAEKIVEWLISIPAVRALLEALVLKAAHDVMAEIFFRSDTDPAFRSQYLALAAKLKLCKTKEEKNALLAQLDALRAS